MKETLITIITIVYNCESGIEKTIKSVLEQDYKSIEYIIIDGASTDSTMTVVNKYRDKINKVISEKDRGISDAFNKGVKEATGDIILFLNAGDVFCNNSILQCVAKDWQNNRPDILFYKVVVGEKRYIPPKEYGEDAKRIWNECQIPHQGAFIRKEVFEKVGLFNIFFKIRMDYDFFARCIKAECSYEYIPKTIVRYEIGGTSMMTDNAITYYREGVAIKLLYGFKIKKSYWLYMFMPKWIRDIGKRVMHR